MTTTTTKTTTTTTDAATDTTEAAKARRRAMFPATAAHLDRIIAAKAAAKAAAAPPVPPPEVEAFAATVDHLTRAARQVVEALGAPDAVLFAPEERQSSHYLTTTTATGEGAGRWVRAATFKAIEAHGLLVGDRWAMTLATPAEFVAALPVTLRIAAWETGRGSSVHAAALAHLLALPVAPTAEQVAHDFAEAEAEAAGSGGLSDIRRPLLAAALAVLAAA